jgi:hypothetical protein
MECNGLQLNAVPRRAPKPCAEVRRRPVCFG